MSWFSKSTSQTSTGDAVAPSTSSTPSQQLTQAEIGKKIEDFTSVSPHAVYLIDGDKGSDKSVICRKNETGGQTCLNLEIDGIKLFKEMQGKQYFCSLPADVDATHFECRKIT